MSSTTIILGSLSLALIAFPSSQERTVRFAPEQGSSVTKRVEWGTMMTTEGFQLDFGGQTFDQGVGLQRETDYTLLVEDELVALGAGRPEDLRRTYTEVVRTVEANDPSDDGSIHVSGLGTYTSALQGHKVRFRWDEDGEEYQREWDRDDPGGGLDEWLEPLEEDLDLRVFLPEGEVEEGDTWEVDASEVRALLAPGGGLRLHADQEDPADDGGEGLRIQVPSVRIGEHLDGIEGNIQCQLLAFEEQGGLRQAVIRIRVEVEVNADVAEELSAQNPKGQSFDIVERELSILGEGDLRWDLDTNQLVSFAFEAEVVQSLSAEWTQDALGDNLLIQLDSSARGTARITIELE